jgi:hypothetical protein
MTYLPVALALLGTVLMAVVIFAPVPVPATVTMSFAPPIPPAHEDSRPVSWAPPDDRLPDTWNPVRGFDPFSDAAPDPAAAEDAAVVNDALALWPLRLDPRAAACDAAARIELVEALASVGGAWACGVLRGALDDEPDAVVRDAIERALRHARPPSDGMRSAGG